MVVPKIEQTEIRSRLTDAMHEIGRCIADPMWAAHAEVSKRTLKRWHQAISLMLIEKHMREEE
jgi:hypothetical protein